MLIVALAGVGLFAWQIARTTLEMARASDAASSLLQQVAAGEADAARQSMTILQVSAENARGASDGPLWSIAAWAPWLGDDVDALRVLARETDRIAREAVPPVMDVAEDVTLDALSPRDGRFDLENLEAVRPQVTDAAEVLVAARTEVAAIDSEALIGRLRVPVRRLQDAVDAAATATDVARQAGDLLPSMLGADGSRRYLLIVQNNAEARSLGGIPGSWAVLQARDGQVRMTRQGSAMDIPPVDEAPEPVPEAEAAVYPSVTATDFRDTTIDADFPSAARYAAALATDAVGGRFDGVVSIDPVALSFLLDGNGSLALDDGTVLTSGTAIDELLNGVYERYADDPEAQNEVFEDAARRIFDAFIGGVGDARATLRGLTRAAAENRLMVWSRDEAEQRRIAGTQLAGQLRTDADEAAVGVFLNDASGSKMQYFLEATSTLQARRCLDGAAQELRLTTSLTSSLGREAQLPASIQGRARGLEPGQQRFNVRIVVPPGGEVEELQVDGESVPVAGGRLGDREVAIVPVVLGPQQTATITTTVTTGDGQTGAPVLTTTPGVRPSPNDVRTASACG